MKKKIQTKFKISLLGDTDVGKTSIINCLMGNKFESTFITTVGVDFYPLSKKIDGLDYFFKIYDTAGQERYADTSSRVIKIADGFILVFGFDNEKTFDRIKVWLNDIKDTVNVVEKVLFLVGNKIDIQERKINKEEAEKFAEENNMKYFETSAKTGDGIKETFNEIFDDLIKLDKKVNGIEEKNKDNNNSKRKKEKNGKKRVNNEIKKEDKEKENNKKKDDEEKNEVQQELNERGNLELDPNTFKNKNGEKKRGWFSRHCFIF